MNLKINILIWRLIRQCGAGPLILRYHPKSALKDLGWYLSFRSSQPVNKEGDAIPWWTYPCIHFLSERLPKDACVLEFGCGHSTVWMSNRVKEIFSVERHGPWANIVATKVQNNANVLLVPSIQSFLNDPGAYMERKKVFDFIIIDADIKSRLECANKLESFLNNHGVVLWDDTERNNDHHIMTEMGFRELCFRGMRPQVIHIGQTSVFYRKDNCLGI